MEAVKYRIAGSDYVGVFATATDDFLFFGGGITQNGKKFLSEALGVKGIDLFVSNSSLVGLFARANSNGIVLSNLILDEEVKALKEMNLGINITVVDSGLNAIGSNVLANDKIAIVNEDYDQKAIRQIGDALGVEVIGARVDGFKTVGANNILTNRGLVVNNRATEAEKERLEKLSSFKSVRTTANTGSLYIGISAIANSRTVVAGEDTTGYELTRIIDGLEQ